MKKKFKIIIYSVILVFFLAFFSLVFRNPLAESGNPNELAYKLRSALLKSDIFAHLLHPYHSLRKLPDILFAPYLFKKSTLPQYSLSVSPEDLEILNNALPDDPIQGYLRQENRVWVKGVFSAGDYSEKVDIKYRGTNANHWNSFKKSFRVEFPKNNLFQGMRALNLVIPYDRYYFIEPLNFYRAKKLGLTTLDLSFSRLNFNGQDWGVYLSNEHLNNEWLEKRRIPDDAMIFGYDDVSTPEDSPDSLSPYFIQIGNKKLYWDKYTSAEHAGAFETFADIAINSDDETFRKSIGNILDLDKYYSWNVMNILAGSDHLGYDGNTLLIYNPATGRFEFSPWDVGVFKISNLENGQYVDNRFALSRRIFSFPEFREQRDKLLKSYIEDSAQLEDDLLFYDNLASETKADFYNDNAKLFNNFQFRRQINEFRKEVASNFESAKTVLTYDTEYYTNELDSPNSGDYSPSYPGSFGRFLEAGESRSEFLVKNLEFRQQGENGIVLGPGVYTFYQDIIIPSGLSFTISAGTTLYLDKGVSIVSYSPVVALAEGNSPIRMLPLDSNKKWGAFAVVNTKRSQSRMYNVEFDGGSGDIINGITFTGMAAFHNADVLIEKSTIKNTGNDDGLNIKYGTVVLKDSFFEGNSSDGIDLDFPGKESVLSGNKFYNNGYAGGGDAIDLSWSNILIENNDINVCTDKGVSVGESSMPVITGNVIQNCDIGIVVKDLSVAEITNNQIKNSRLGISVYQKKDVFGGGIANVKEVHMENVETEYDKDKVSDIIMTD